MQITKEGQIGKPYKQIKEDTLWRWFSRYIRLRDSDNYGMVVCVTCGKNLFWKDSQAGHFRSAGKKATKYHEQNVHNQCNQCNHKLWGGGMAGEYAIYLDKRYGPGTAEKLINLSKVIKGGIQPYMYKTVSDHYRMKVRGLLKEKGLTL